MISQKFKVLFNSFFFLYLSIFNIHLIKASDINNISDINVIKKDDLIKNNRSNTKFIQEDFYILGTGDTLAFSVIGIPSLDTQIKILNDGNAIIPLLGPIKLRGLTITGASEFLGNLLSGELINPKVELFILENRPIKIAVIGEVSRPGIYKLDSKTNDLPTVITGIEEAGGISNSADLNNLVLKRKLPGEDLKYKKTILNFKNLIFEGDVTQNPYLFDGDIIEIKQAKFPGKDQIKISSTSLTPNAITVNFLGEVAKPGRLKLESNTTLIDGILAAGGPKNWRSNYGNVELLRINQNGTAFRKKYKINLSQNYSEKNNPILSNGDSVWIRRNTFAKSTDALSAISSPFRDLVNIWSLFRLLE